MIVEVISKESLFVLSFFRHQEKRTVRLKTELSMTTRQRQRKKLF